MNEAASSMEQPEPPVGTDPAASGTFSPAFVGASIGEKLRASREARGLSADQVAKALKLSLSQVEALEMDDWWRLPNNAVIRGFVRNYARLTHLDPSALMRMMDALSLCEKRELDIPEDMHVSVRSDKAFRLRDYLYVCVGATALLLAVLVYWFFPADMASKFSSLRSVLSRDEKDDAENRTALTPSATALSDAGASLPPAAASPVPTRVEAPAPDAQNAGSRGDAASSAPIAAVAAATPLVPTASAVHAAAASAALAALAAQPAPVSPAAPSNALPAPTEPGVVPVLPNAAGGGLQLSFSEGAWVEVRDGSDRVVFSRMNDAGTRQGIRVLAPFSLIVGNAANVKAYYNGKAIDLSTRANTGVARVTVR